MQPIAGTAVPVMPCSVRSMSRIDVMCRSSFALSLAPTLLESVFASASTRSSADCRLSSRFWIAACAAASVALNMKMRAYAAYGSVSGGIGFCIPTGPACECRFQMSFRLPPTR